MSAGRHVPLSVPRRLVGDFLHASRGIPLIPIERTMRLGELRAARERSPLRPGWSGIFLKAFGILSAAQPELRRVYLARPWPRLYEHPVPVGALAVEREVAGEQAVLLATLRSPDSASLSEIDAFLRQRKDAPVETIRPYVRALRTARLPWPLRRLLWGVLDWSGTQRVRHLGTFGISVTAGMGAGTLALVTPWTTAIHYGLFNADGTLPVRITFDHRVLDGATVARALVELEEVLSGPILAELRQCALAA